MPPVLVGIQSLIQSSDGEIERKSVGEVLKKDGGTCGNFTLTAWISDAYKVRIYVNPKLLVRELFDVVEKQFEMKMGVSFKIKHIQDRNHNDLPPDGRIELMLK